MKCGFPVKEALCMLQEPSVQYKCLFQLEKFAETTNSLFTEFIAGSWVINAEEIGEAVNLYPGTADKGNFLVQWVWTACR